MDYGAVGNGETLDTQAIQTAIDSCNSTDFGNNESINNIIIFPSSYNFLTFPFVIRYDNTHNYKLMRY